METEIMQACRELWPGLDGPMQKEAVDVAERLGSAQSAGQCGEEERGSSRSIISVCALNSISSVEQPFTPDTACEFLRCHCHRPLY